MTNRILTDAQVAELIAKHGCGAKFADAACKVMGWRPGVNGRSQKWYEAFRGWLGDTMERALLTHATNR